MYIGIGVGIKYTQPRIIGGGNNEPMGVFERGVWQMGGVWKMTDTWKMNP